MEVYLESIKTAILLFPFLAFLITIPYLIFQYRKYGSVPLIRSVIIYTFILYLLAAYFLVILPLPTREAVATMAPKTPQLIPFSFLADFIDAIKTSNNLSFFTAPIVYTILFNLLLTFPFGVYLRYYFKKKWYFVIPATFGLSLFFELTQLTGLYGIYDKAYRLFDVDDLIINTLGGFLGYLFTPIITILLPKRDRIDEISYLKGKTVSIYRRFLAFLVDLFFFMIIFFITILISRNNNYYLLAFILILIYYVIIPAFTKMTIGKLVVKIKLSSTAKYPVLAIIIRQALLYFLIVFGPVFFINYLNYLPDFIILLYSLFLIYSYFTIFIRFLGYKKPLFYEHLTKTENISMISYTPKSSQKEENMVNYTISEEEDNESGN